MKISPITFGVMLPPNPRGKNSTNSQNNSGTSDENTNSKVCTIKILLDSGASTSIVRKDVLQECHKIFKNKKNKWSTMAGTYKITFITEIILKKNIWSTMAGTFDTSFVTEIISKFPEFRLTDKLVTYNLILGRDILHELGISFNFKNKTIIWQQVSISMKQPKCMAKNSL